MENILGNRDQESDHNVDEAISEELLEWKNLDLTYYELTEAVHRFHMMKV